MRPVFIGGTGRCGTTILRRVLADHQNVFAFHNECRFIIDPDGMLDVYLALVEMWSPHVVDTKIRRFEALMHQIGRSTPLKKFAWRAAKLAPSWLPIPRGRYSILSLERSPVQLQVALEGFKQALGVIPFEGRWSGSVAPCLETRILSSSEALTEPTVRTACRDFLEVLFTPVFEGMRVTHWVEDTPFNLLHAELILRLFPDARFLHIFRDPRDVIASYKMQQWAPSDLPSIVGYYRSVMGRTLEVLNRLPRASWTAISLEELSANPARELQRICKFVDLAWDESVLRTRLDKVNAGRWRRDFTSEEQEVLADLDPFVEELGYASESTRPARRMGR